MLTVITVVTDPDLILLACDHPHLPYWLIPAVHEPHPHRLAFAFT
jgi:hypothetical protein